MQSMALRQFAIDETSGGNAAHAIGEGHEPPKTQLTVLSRVRTLIPTPPWQTPAAASNEHWDASAAYGTRTLEEIMADGVPEGTARSKVCLPDFLHSVGLQGVLWRSRHQRGTATACDTPPT